MSLGKINVMGLLRTFNISDFLNFCCFDTLKILISLRVVMTPCNLVSPYPTRKRDTHHRNLATAYSELRPTPDSTRSSRRNNTEYVLKFTCIPITPVPTTCYATP